MAKRTFIGHWLDNSDECFIEVNLKALFKASSNPACFVSLNLPSRASLKPIDPLSTKNAARRGSRN